jgi:hypothetical protein
MGECPLRAGGDSYFRCYLDMALSGNNREEDIDDGRKYLL